MDTNARRFWLLSLVVITGCEGFTSGGVDGPGEANRGRNGTQPDLVCTDEVAASPPAVSRLVPEQYMNSVRDILGGDATTAVLAPVAGQAITEAEVEKLNTAAEQFVALNRHRTDVPCDVAGAGSEACAEGFIRALGRRAFRRPLQEEEVAAFKTSYRATRALTGVTPAITFRDAIDVLAKIILQSPQVLYVRSYGLADETLPSGVLRTTGFERATRLSYLLWNSTPDEELLAAAESGALDTAEGMKAQAQRLLNSPRARSTIREFAAKWLEINATARKPSLEDVVKNAASFPDDSASLRRAMREEISQLYEDAFFSEGGSFKNLMTTTRAYVNGPLAKLYQVTGGPTASDTFAYVDLDPKQRAGLFTRAGFLMHKSGSEYPSPIHRGVHLLRGVLCEELGDPPPNVNNTPVTPADSTVELTIRQLTDKRTSTPDCHVCHASINPLGHALGNYDAMGAFRVRETGTTQGGHAFTANIDASVSLPLASLSGTVAGPVEFANKLAQSSQVHDCLAARWFEEAFGRQPTSQEACSLQRSQKQFRDSDDMKDLVLSLIVSDSALFVRAQP